VEPYLHHASMAWCSVKQENTGTTLPLPLTVIQLKLGYDHVSRLRIDQNVVQDSNVFTEGGYAADAIRLL